MARIEMKKARKALLAAGGILLLSAGIAAAQNATATSAPATDSVTAAVSPDSAKPLEITADETLEWHRDEKQYIARGNAVAKQGDTEIHTAILTADYRETNKSSVDIYRMTADGGVTIVSRGHTVKGDKATYDVTSGKALITGKALSLAAPEETVTARDNFEYLAGEGRLTANGDVLVVRGQDRIRAETMSAYFAKDGTGQNQLKKLTASRNVVITTPTEKLTGDSGTYTAATDMAELHGNVRIERGPNVLQGDSADVNLTTHVSRMIGGSGPVRGIFYPGSEKAAEKPAIPAPAPIPVPASAGTASAVSAAAPRPAPAPAVSTPPPATMTAPAAASRPSFARMPINKAPAKAPVPAAQVSTPEAPVMPSAAALQGLSPTPPPAAKTPAPASVPVQTAPRTGGLRQIPMDPMTAPGQVQGPVN